MLFSSLIFLYAFLPCTLLAYFLTPRRGKNPVLLLASLLFYAWGEPRYLILILLNILLGFTAGLGIYRFRGRLLGRLFLLTSVAGSLGLLCCFKYGDFFLSAINGALGISLPLWRLALPVGISFYTFQILSYTIDLYRGDVEVQRNPVSFALYVALFPQLIAGPIVRYRDVAQELQERKHSTAMAYEGACRFLVGLGKKVILANNLGLLCQSYRSSADPTVLFAWLSALGFFLQIYYDFSGYSDMAIGLGRIFGFRFPENFNYPYIAASITEFWRRWHISLGSWFRDYLYIPLGGNRKGKGRQLFNILIVWLATGLWHGADWNFVLWGLWFAVLLLVEKLILLPVLQKRRGLGRCYVLLAVLLGFILFDASSVCDAWGTIRALFGGGGLPLASAEAVYQLRSCAVLLAIAAIGATPLPRRAFDALGKTHGGRAVLTVLEPMGLVGLLAVCTAYLVDGSFNPFLYFRF